MLRLKRTTLSAKMRSLDATNRVQQSAIGVQPSLAAAPFEADR
jgi:hypothetical protein